MGGLVVAFTLLLAPAAARAGNFTVTSIHNSGPGSLRKAITNANASSGSDTIAINTTGTLTLQSSLPQINTDVAITGPGQAQFAISGANLYRPLTIHGGRKVSISKLEVADGRCNNACGSFAGGIANEGSLTLTDVTVAGNTASASGGTNPGALGGGIWSNGTLNLVRTRVRGNTVSASGYSGQGNPYGGGIMSLGTLTVARSTIDSNTARAIGGLYSNVHGGGIQNSGTLKITRSTLTGNTTIASGSSTSSGSYGAALGNTNSSNVHVTIDRSTIGANTATAGSPGVSETGGVEAYGASFSITSSTIANNSAAFYSNVFDSATVDVKNTVISDPAGGGVNCLGNAMNSQGYNLADDSSCNLGQGSDQEDTNPMLTSLAFHGGPTKTYGLQVGSPAIDRGRNSTGETVDQRGLKRPSDFGAISNALGNGTDIGAFEVQDTVPPDTVIDSGPSATTHDPSPNFTFHATEAGSTFQCRVDARAYAACTSPRTTQHLTDGTHTFTVRARDAASNLDPSPASRSFTVKTAAVKRSGSTLVITAAPGARDNLEVMKPSASTIRVTDKPAGAYPGSGVHAVSGSGCTTSGDSTANCNASGIAKIQIASGDEADRVVNATSLPSSLPGGSGDDILTGGSVKDTITGGSGADTMKGRNGDDLLRARDLASDTLINCDGGSAPGGADTADIDLLPKDPDSVVLGCETKTRH